MACSLELYEFLCEQEHPKPISECGFCGHSLAIEKEDDMFNVDESMENSGYGNSALDLIHRHSKFSNIEELDAENESESDCELPVPKQQTEESYKQSTHKSENVIETNNEAPTDLIFKNNGIRVPPTKTMTLDNLIVRDATEEEKVQLSNISAAQIEKMVDEELEVSERAGNRCSIIQMTPRGDSILNTDREDL